YYISSKVLSAEQAANAVREHWVLDVSMNEDACQIYKDYGAENVACLRHMSLNMLREEPTKHSCGRPALSNNLHTLIII
ncbi:hypothetical protein GNP64_06000, partial [Aliivibrio fischeri]|nr:hypothetical protein [Aliivibrio fischeri]